MTSPSSPNNKHYLLLKFERSIHKDPYIMLAKFCSWIWMRVVDSDFSDNCRYAVTFISLVIPTLYFFVEVLSWVKPNPKNEQLHSILESFDGSVCQHCTLPPKNNTEYGLFRIRTLIPICFSSMTLNEDPIILYQFFRHRNVEPIIKSVMQIDFRSFL